MGRADLMVEDMAGIASPCRLSEAADVAAVAALFARCDDHFMLQDGEAATLQDAHGLFHDVPPGRLGSELVALGYRGPQRLDAVVVMLPDHPEPGVWYVPFMLVDPAARRRGLGRSLHARVTDQASRGGAFAIQLVTLDDNGDGKAFWQRLGYRAIRRVGPDRFKSLDHFRVEFRLDLSA